MLKLVEEKDLPRIIAFCGGSLLGTYLACRAQCYGTAYDFVRFWYASYDETLHAVIGSIDGAAVLLADAEADPVELRAFLHMQGFSSVMTNEVTATRCGLAVTERKTAFRFAGTAVQTESTAQSAEMKDVYTLISRCIPGSFDNTKEAYLRFLSDFTFRKNRNAARLSAALDNGVLQGCALTAAETQIAAVLSGVAVDASVRKTGIGRRVVLSLVHTLQAAGKDVYVIALNKSAETFYQRIGFEKTETICYMEGLSDV